MDLAASRLLAGTFCARRLRRRADRPDPGERDRRPAAARQSEPAAARSARGLPHRGGRAGAGPLRRRRRDRAGAGAELDRLRRRPALHLPDPPRDLGRRQPGHRPAGRGAAARRAEPGQPQPVEAGARRGREHHADDRLRARDRPARPAPQFPAIARPSRAWRSSRTMAAPGPIGWRRSEPAALRLTCPRTEEEAEESPGRLPTSCCAASRAASAVARFAAGETDLVARRHRRRPAVARAADLPAARLVFDPVGGLFGLAFAGNQRAARRRRRCAARCRWRSIATGSPPRSACRASPARTSIVAPGVQELPDPAQPDWAAMPLAERRDAAARRRRRARLGHARSTCAWRCPTGPATGCSSPISGATGG